MREIQTHVSNVSIVIRTSPSQSSPSASGGARSRQHEADDDPILLLETAVDAVTAMVLEGSDAGRLRRIARSLTRECSRLEGVRARAVATATRTGAVEQSGASSGAAWLAAATGGTTAAASRTASLGDALDRLPALASALDRGLVGTEQAVTLARAAGRGVLDDEQLDAMVVEAAALPAATFSRILRGAEARTDQRQLRRDERLAHERRSASWRRLDDGTLVGSFRLAPVPGEALATAIDVLAVPDGADVPDELRRSAPQRRADALASLAQLALDRADLPVTATVRPHITVAVPVTMLLGDPDETDDAAAIPEWRSPPRGEPDAHRPAPQGDGAPAATHTGARTHTGRRDRAAERVGAVGTLPDGTIISAEAARRLLCDATVRRLVLDAEGRPVDVGRATRTWSSAQRTAVESVDGRCRGPACDRPLSWTQIHHVRWWRDRGTTSVDNGIALCSHCHDLVHHGGWDLSFDPATRIATWTSSLGTTVVTRPTGPGARRR